MAVDVLVGVIGMLCGFIVIQTIENRRERKDLYNRLMSKGLTDYTSISIPPHKPKSRHREVLKQWRKRGDKK